MDVPSTARRMKDCNEINQNLKSNNDNRNNINNNNNSSINSLFSDSTFNNINNSEINFSLDNNINNNQEQMNKELKGISEFKFIYKNKTYSTLISLSTDKKYLNIIAKEENILNFYYESKMKFEELKKFDKIFRICDDIEDSLNSMITIFKSENNKIKEITNDKLTLSINIRQLDGSFKTTDLDLFRRNQDKDVILTNLCEQINYYNENIASLKDEMNKINSENNSLREEITNLKNLHSKEINELREKIEMLQNQLDKTNKLESDIVKRKKDINFIIERLKKVNLKENNNQEKINFEFNLLYRATEDGDSANDFHTACDKHKNTLVLVKTKKNLKFGGFTTETWDGNDVDKEDKNAFCFSLDKMKIYNSIKGKKAIFASPNSGPAFENCIFEIKDSCFKAGGMCSEDSNCYFDNHEIKCEINNGDELFGVKEVEVYEVIFK